MTRKKRHHIIPEFYLNGFTDIHGKKFVWVYEKGGSEIKSLTPHNVAVKSGYYSAKIRIEGFSSDVVEDMLSWIEGKAAPIIKKIINQKKLSDEDRFFFSLFLASMMTRVPTYRTMVEKCSTELAKKFLMVKASNLESFKSMIDKYEKETGNKLSISAEKFREFIFDEDKYEIKADPRISLPMVLMVEEYTNIFEKMSWAFLKATYEQKFITSDNPVYFYDPTHNPASFDGVGLINKNVEVIFPLTKDMAFLGTWKEYKGYFRKNKEIVKTINKKTVISALHFVYSSQHSDGLNRLVQKYKDTAPRVEVT